MEKEAFFSVYCRQLDASRMVEVIVTDGQIDEVDCCFGNCVHQPNCTIAQKIEELLKESSVC